MEEAEKDEKCDNIDDDVDVQSLAWLETEGTGRQTDQADTPILLLLLLLGLLLANTSPHLDPKPSLFLADVFYLLKGKR